MFVFSAAYVPKYNTFASVAKAGFKTERSFPQFQTQPPVFRWCESKPLKLKPKTLTAENITVSKSYMSTARVFLPSSFLPLL